MFVDNYLVTPGDNMAPSGLGAVDHMSHVQYDPGIKRPYRDSKGRACVTVNTRQTDANGKPIFKKKTLASLIANGASIEPVDNATLLRKDEWIELDRVVLRAARQRLRAWSDLASANSFGGFNGMSKMILEHETQSDPGVAVVSMDGIREGQNDGPQYQLEGLPLPITHCDFFFSKRRLANSRNSGTPLDTTMAEAAGRRVAESIEQTLIGTVAGTTYGVAANYGNTPTVYGYRTHPDRNTKSDLTVPTGDNPDSTVADVLTMRSLAYNDRFYGPFMLYHSTDWDVFLDNDYVKGTVAQGLSSPGTTLRERLRKIEGIQDVRRLDFLTNTFTLLLVQMTSDVARAVNGMDITTMQWETRGGMQVNFKVMAIQVPQLRSDFNSRMGLVHGTTA